MVENVWTTHSAHVVTFDVARHAATATCHVAGSFSGTLGYVMSGLQSGGKFSDVIGCVLRVAWY